MIQRNVMIVCTTLVIVSNAVFLCISVFWWLELKMDLENLLEHSARQKRTVTRLVMWLQSFLPDWEGKGREAELVREKIEAERT